jgi:hypothetical protein
MVNALIAEINIRKNYLPVGSVIETIYFGVGKVYGPVKVFLQ